MHYKLSVEKNVKLGFTKTYYAVVAILILVFAAVLMTRDRPSQLFACFLRSVRTILNFVSKLQQILCASG